MVPLTLSTAVSEALAKGAPVVALESTIITHGMPWPDNLAMARRVEATVREVGATPATIAVIEGRLHIGLDEDTLEALAKADHPAKLSRADLAIALTKNLTGGTTVAATMIAAHFAGIEVFATGGIGGVHRGADQSFDISADLTELAQTPVTVVSAGAKAILDLPKTLEVLETNGTPVIAYGQDAFPAFWSRQSPLDAPQRMDSPTRIARAHLMRQALAIPGGQLIANPIPAEAEISNSEIDPIIAHAIREAETEGVSGKALTPFLLARIYALSETRSLAANIALVLNNARLGAEIAIEIARLRKSTDETV